MKRVRCLSRLAWVAALPLLFAGAALADHSHTFTGSNVGGPTWNRPIDDGPTVTTSAVPYQAQVFFLPQDATCRIASTQSFDGYIHLYRNSFNPANPLTNLLGGDDDDSTPGSGLGVGTSHLPDPSDSSGEPDLMLTAGRYILVTSGFGPSGQGDFSNTITCNISQPIQGSCFYAGFGRENQLCNHERFAVRIINVSNSSSGIGTPVRLSSSDSSFFWFYSPTNFEAVVKVLDACALNDRFWVFAAALTNQAYTIQVGDAQTGVIKSYSNQLGVRAPAVADTNAFDCTP